MSATQQQVSVISKDVFDKMKKCVKQQLLVKPEKVSIRLADGTLSNKSLGSVQLDVQKLDRSTEVSKVTFFVLSGPMCLLGRYALEKLWPEEYSALKRVTSVNICTTQITSSNPGRRQKEVCKIGIPEVSDSSCQKKEVCKIGIPE